ncbi:hypothetical protein XBP1_330041 [Xenorhabdus bovienii str. puntauvense]|uniref:Uncharacterized protein n=3 Tax=Xenorhabdus bovienii TaxID=40576 RepID=A0A077NJ89_XENBV|nr:hypothetical protein XBP1_330041 [Xenorhabdus bovienii str. puntauvense]CDH01320.1 hypothetical protein XBFM1_2050088 [Xenorhabdus bovienii str. feltiae Moldova]CDH25475.1 hypothetical protein XBKB1_4060004 [Xenorhabdus bovienii str. kraussei Becker Underwood]
MFSVVISIISTNIHTTTDNNGVTAVSGITRSELNHFLKYQMVT